MPLLLAPVERFLMTAVGQTVSILDSHDGDDLLGLLDFGGRDFAQPDVANLALLLHPFERAERLSSSGVRGSIRCNW